jgi:hypothetical protein
VATAAFAIVFLLAPAKGVVWSRKPAGGLVDRIERRNGDG